MLTPVIIGNDELDKINEVNDEVLTPSKTYKLDLENGRLLSETIDNDDAIRQAVFKHIKTLRDRYLIYTQDYGCEIQYLMGKNYSQEYLEIEVPRLINEALMVDNRIIGTENFVIKKEDEKLYISFNVLTEFDTSITMEVTV